MSILRQEVNNAKREYFAARAVSNMLENNPGEAESFFRDSFLSHEILFFAAEIMKQRDFDYESSLLKLIEKTRGVEMRERMKLGYLGGNAVNLLYQYKGKLPEYDWRNLVLDGAILPDADLSGKDFSGTSLQYANLDNVNFTGSNFSQCNLTEVRIEETTPVQSISYDIHLFFYDREGRELKLKSTIEIAPNIKLIKASPDYLLLNEENGRQSRLALVDLNKQSVVKSYVCSPFTLCDQLDNHAFIIFNKDEELQIIDITSQGNPNIVVPTEEKVSCIATCKCRELEDQYLLGLGLYNGAVQVWQIYINNWEIKKLLAQTMHANKQPVKDISFIDENRIVSGGLDKIIKLLTFNQKGKSIGEPKELKMALQCRGMKIAGMIREQEQKKFREFIDKVSQ